MKARKDSYQTKCTLAEEQGSQLYQKNPNDPATSALAHPGRSAGWHYQLWWTTETLNSLKEGN